MISTLIKSVRGYRRVTVKSVIYISLEVIMEVFIPLILAYLIDNGINAGDVRVIFISGALLVCVAMFSLLFGILAAKNSAISSAGFAKNLRKDMYYKVQDYSFSNIDKFRTSSIITRLTTDVSNVQNAFQMLIRIGFRAPLMFIFSLVMAFYINKKISLVFLCVIPILGGILFLISKKAHPRFESVFKTYDDLNNDVQENVRGIRVVKSNVCEEYEKKKFFDVSGLIYKRFCSAERLVSLNSPIMQFSMYLSNILIVWFGVQLITVDSLTTGELTSLITYSGSILSSLMMLSMIYVMITISLASAERIVEVLNEKPSIKNRDNAIKTIKDGSIEFKNVSFSYVDDINKLSLQDVNLSIKSGEVIGIIGSTGSSKSTLISLISRLYDVTSGELLVGGIDVKDYDLKTLRDNVAVVLQKNVLFSGTILENLRWGNENATLDECKKACHIACIDTFIDSLPDKYNTYIEQGGTNVSGGQKQRLCIARALLKKPKILILDDSTSAVDTATEASIRECFDEYIPDVTTIIISQRIVSIEKADRVIIMDEGRVVDFDTPKKLLKTSEIYKEVYNSQKKGE